MIIDWFFHLGSTSSLKFQLFETPKLPHSSVRSYLLVHCQYVPIKMHINTMEQE